MSHFVKYRNIIFFYINIAKIRHFNSLGGSFSLVITRFSSKVGQTASRSRLVQEAGQFLSKRDCPAQSGTVGQSVIIVANILMVECESEK